MLQTNKTRTTSGNVVIEEQHVVSLHASLPADESTNVNYSITNNELYLANKDECRKGILEFLAQVFALEDE